MGGGAAGIGLIIFLVILARSRKRAASRDDGEFAPSLPSSSITELQSREPSGVSNSSSNQYQSLARQAPAGAERDSYVMGDFGVGSGTVALGSDSEFNSARAGGAGDAKYAMGDIEELKANADRVEQE